MYVFVVCICCVCICCAFIHAPPPPSNTHSWSTILAHLHLPPLHLLRQCLIQHQYTAAIAVATRYSLPGLEEVYVRQWIVEQVVQQQVVQQQPHERGEEEGVGLGDETTVDTAAAGGGVSGVSGVSDNDETPRGGDGGDDDALNSATSTSSTTGLRGNTAALKNMDYSRSTPVVLDFSMCPHPVTDRMQQVVLCMDTAIGVPSLSHGTTAGLLMQALGLLNEVCCVSVWVCWWVCIVGVVMGIVLCAVVGVDVYTRSHVIMHHHPSSSSCIINSPQHRSCKNTRCKNNNNSSSNNQVPAHQ